MGHGDLGSYTTAQRRIGLAEGHRQRAWSTRRAVAHTWFSVAVYEYLGQTCVSGICMCFSWWKSRERWTTRGLSASSIPSRTRIANDKLLLHTGSNMVWSARGDRHRRSCERCGYSYRTRYRGNHPVCPDCQRRSRSRSRSRSSSSSSSSEESEAEWQELKMYHGTSWERACEIERKRWLSDQRWWSFGSRCVCCTLREGAPIRARLRPAQRRDQRHARGDNLLPLP